MNFEVLNCPVNEVLCDTLIISLFEGTTVPGGVAGEIDATIGNMITAVLRDQPKCTRYGETTVLYTYSLTGPKHTILLGLGKKEELTVDRIRALAGTVIRTVRKLSSQVVATVLYGTDDYGARLSAQAITEGSLLGIYQFEWYKTEKKDSKPLETLYFIEPDTDKTNDIKAGIEKGKIIGESVNFARDLVNHPANYVSPSKMAAFAAEIADRYGAEITVLDREEMKEKRMHALLAVAQGTSEPPKFIVLKYTGSPGKPYTAFIGKGITFDSGGISLKPSEGMGEMKDDMAGGAAVLGAMQAICQLRPASNILGIVPCTENMPSGSAFKPGDVISSMGGKSIEIISSDAEGRLILADAVVYAQKIGAAKIVDLATLTGACVVALGKVRSGVITNNQEWCDIVLEAAKQAGEKMWQLPHDDDYGEQIKSDIADLKNSGGRYGGAITAGLFITKFAGETPLVHIDIAGTVSSEKDAGYNVKGATGVGVRTLVQLAESIAML